MLMKKGQYFNTFIFQLKMTVKPLWSGDGGSGVISLGVKITRQSLSFHHRAQYLPSLSEHTTHNTEHNEYTQTDHSIIGIYDIFISYDDMDQNRIELLQTNGLFVSQNVDITYAQWRSCVPVVKIHGHPAEIYN